MNKETSRCFNFMMVVGGRGGGGRWFLQLALSTDELSERSGIFVHNIITYYMNCQHNIFYFTIYTHLKSRETVPCQDHFCAGGGGGNCFKQQQEQQAEEG